MLGGRGTRKVELHSPADITADSAGLLYISELDNHRISVFTSEGDFVTTFGSEGEESGQFYFPVGGLVDDSGLLYVCDSSNDRVQLF